MVKIVSSLLIRGLRRATEEAVVQQRLQPTVEISVTEATATIIRATGVEVRDHQTEAALAAQERLMEEMELQGHMQEAEAAAVWHKSVASQMVVTEFQIRFPALHSISAQEAEAV
jgi:hypothetical protein